jgi:peroxiredoxin
MVLTPSTMLALGTAAPDFTLPDPYGRKHSLADFQGAPALLVAFICNHCPYVKHVADAFAELATEYQDRGVAVVGISSNDVGTHPGDSPEKMVEEVKRRGYTFPYLYDASQKVAQAYRAACTPDFYVFDKKQRLAYRGQMCASRPDSGIPVTGKDLRSALDAVLEGDMPSSEQTPSIGCNIKWKPGNEPDYFQG